MFLLNLLSTFQFVLLVFLFELSVFSSCTGLTLGLSCRLRLANPQLPSDFNEAFDVELMNSHFLFAAVATATQNGTLVDTGLENALFKTTKTQSCVSCFCCLLVVLVQWFFFKLLKSSHIGCVNLLVSPPYM